MARLITRGTGTNDYYGLMGRLLAAAYSGQVLEGFNVTQQSSANMTVKVNPGMALIPTGSSPTNGNTQAILDTVGGFDVTITTANGSNPRRDLIIATDRTSVTGVNNPNALVLLAVAGTPASSPADPNASAIQAALAAAGGSASDPYIILARVAVGTGVTQITTANITDLRTMAGPVVPGGSLVMDKLTAWAVTGNMTAINPITTALTNQASVTLPSTTVAHKYLITATFSVSHQGQNTVRDYTTAVRLGSTTLKTAVWSASTLTYLNPISINHIHTASASGGETINFSITRNVDNGGDLSSISHYSIVDLGRA